MSQKNLKEILLGLETELLSPAVRDSGARLDELFADDFVEFGQSGRIYDKESIVSELTRSNETVNFQIDDFRIVTANEESALVTYRCDVRSGDGEFLRKSNRSSLWQVIDGRWQMLFHQGTKLND